MQTRAILTLTRSSLGEREYHKRLHRREGFQQYSSPDVSSHPQRASPMADLDDAEDIAPYHLLEEQIQDVGSRGDLRWEGQGGVLSLVTDSIAPADLSRRPVLFTYGFGLTPAHGQEIARPLWLGDSQIAANLSDKLLIDLPMPRYCRHFVFSGIEVHRVTPTFAQESTTVTFEMSNEISALHAAQITSGSRITSCPTRDRSESIRFASSTNRMASRRFSRVSSSVSPCVFAPGNSSTNPM